VARPSSTAPLGRRIVTTLRLHLLPSAPEKHIIGGLNLICMHAFQGETACPELFAVR